MAFPKENWDPPFDFADDLTWPTDELRAYMNNTELERRDANPRKSEVLQRKITHAAFELVLRELERKELDKTYEAPAA